MFRTLHSRLILFFLTVSVIPILLIGSISYSSEKQALTRQLEENMFVLVENMAFELENFTSRRISDVNVLAKNPILTSPTNYKDKKEFLHYFQNIYEGLYDGIVLLNKEGTVFVDTNNHVEGIDLSQRKWFKAARNGLTYGSDIYYSDFVKHPLLVLAAPVRDRKGTITGVISPSIDLDQFWQTVDRFSGQRKRLGLSGFAFVLNSQGDTIAHPDHSKIFFDNFFKLHQITGQALSELYDNRKLYHDNIDNNVVAFARVKPYKGNTGEWLVGISLPQNELYEPLNSLIIKYVWTFGIVLAIVVLLSFQLASFIVKPFHQLVAVTAHLGSDMRAQSVQITSYAEIQALMKTFNKMFTKLRHREQGHKTSTAIIETTDNCVLALDNKNVITIFNKQCEDLFEIPKNQVIGTTLDSLREKSTKFASFINNPVLTACISEKKPVKELEVDITLDGITHSFLIFISMLHAFDDETQPENLVFVIQDITEKRLMEAELIKSEKLQVAGQLAAGMAHEIRNPLTTIKGFLQLWDQKKENSCVTKETFTLVLHELDRINQIISGFLSLAKPSSDNPTTADIHELLAEIIMLEESGAMNLKVDVVKNYNSRGASWIQPIQIKQVFINVMRNAFEAMPDGGKLTITTVVEDQSIIIKFSDTGHGIDSSNLLKVGTPFFTTKDNGTGIGLMMCYRIVHELKGTLDIVSEKGKGTTVTVTLPKADEILN